MLDAIIKLTLAIGSAWIISHLLDLKDWLSHDSGDILSEAITTRRRGRLAAVRRQTGTARVKESGDETPQQMLRADLRGRHLRIPDVTQLYTHWPAPRLSPHLDQLRRAHDGKVLEWFPDKKVRDRMMGIDVPLFAAMWWPAASVDRLLAVVYYTLWLFVWDDHFDGAALDPSLSTTCENMSNVHHQAFEYATFHLSLDKPKAEPKAPSRYSKILAEAGKLFRTSLTKNQLDRLLKQIGFYMECSLLHQMHVNNGTMPTTLAEYWQMRSGDSAYLTYCALNEYMMNISLPDELIETRQMKKLWFECMRCIIYVNDLVSLKKEMDASLCSLVPIMMNEMGCGLPGVMAQVVEDLKTSIRAVDETADAILAETRKNETLHKDVQKYMHGLKTPLTGNWNWSLATRRYGIQDYVQKDGSLDIPL